MATCPSRSDDFRGRCRAAAALGAAAAENGSPGAALSSPAVRATAAELKALRLSGAIGSYTPLIDLVDLTFAFETAEAVITESSAAAAQQQRELLRLGHAYSMMVFVGPRPLPECIMPEGLTPGEDPVEMAADAVWADGAPSLSCACASLTLDHSRKSDRLRSDFCRAEDRARVAARLE